MKTPLINSFWRTTLLLGALLVEGLRANAVELPLQGPATADRVRLELPDAQATADTQAALDETPQLWFVELGSPPTADGTGLSVVRNEKKAFRAAALQAGLKYAERFAFDTLWNGLSIQIARNQLPALTRITGVKRVFPVGMVSLPVTDSLPGPDLVTALAMTGADIAQNTLGLTGAGIRVGIIDTGIDYDHSDLGGGGVPNGTSFPTARVVAGYDFVGDAYNADPTSPGYNPVPAPDPNPDDCAGHGTHVAGIVGAHGHITGVAPGVVFGAYRVFGCEGSTSDDVIIAALERALADGMQVVNMSLGSPFEWPESPPAQASDRLVNRGVVVVCSIGNNGADGLYSSGSPGVSSKAIGVASFDNTHFNLSTFTISPDNTPIGYVPAAGAPPPPTTGTFSIARTGTITNVSDACNPLPAGSLAGKVALIRRGGCTFYTKARNAMNAGAVAVVLYNNAAGLLNPTVAGSPPITIPVVAVTRSDGVLINSRLDAGAVTMTWTDGFVSIPNPTANLISSFSSYGLSPDLALKPDIGAPGGSIRSTYPLELGGVTTLSGTSMSSPHVAGAVALYLQAHPNTPPQSIGSILQNNAVPKPWWGNPGLGFLDNVHRQGAGMLRIDDAVLANVRIEPGELALGESQTRPAKRRLTLQNTDAAAITFDLSHEPALCTGSNTFTPTFDSAPATVTASAASVTVPAGGSAKVDVTITANSALDDHSLYGGYIRFTPQGGGKSYRVPYAGFKGDYQSIQVLTPTPAGFPWLAKLSGDSLTNQPGGASFTLVDDDLAYVVFHLDHQSRRLLMEAFDAGTGRSWRRVLDLPYFIRNTSSTGFFAIGWDGTTFNGNKINRVPNGQYVIKLSVLKALGDDNNPADWETWTSPVITLARP